MINFGIFSWLAVPLLNALKWVHGYIGNWGWSIVVLTVLINLAMFPLRHKSVVSMRKMQEIQPQMKAIQDRYAKYKVTDPERQKMNTRGDGAVQGQGREPGQRLRADAPHDARSCLPSTRCCRRQSKSAARHFIGWIHNLSAPDPLFISPLTWAHDVLAAEDDAVDGRPTQQKIMMFMPIMFTFMSLSFPSGLVIYWTVSNVFTIGQQYFTNYLIGRRPQGDRP